jgi:hypothetical protein
MIERIATAHLYPDMILGNLPTLEPAIVAYLEEYAGKTVTPGTPHKVILKYHKAITNLGKTIGKEVDEAIKSGSLTPQELYLLATQPARSEGIYDNTVPGRVGIVAHEGGKHRYHILIKEQTPNAKGRDLLILLQRLPKYLDTRHEIHRTGIEIYIPLTDGTNFNINGIEHQPDTLSQMLIVLPEDVHHHQKSEGQGPARVLIIGGLGFGPGEKLPDEESIQTMTEKARERFPEIPRILDFK